MNAGVWPIYLQIWAEAAHNMSLHEIVSAAFNHLRSTTLGTFPPPELGSIRTENWDATNKKKHETGRGKEKYLCLK